MARSRRIHQAIPNGAEKGSELAEENYEVVLSLRDISTGMKADGYEKQIEKIALADDQNRIYKRNNLEYRKMGKDNVIGNSYQVQQFKDDIQELNNELAEGARNKNMDVANKQQESKHNFNAQNASNAQDKIRQNKEELANVEKYNRPKNPGDFAENPLLEKYPQGITEEKTVEDNRVILTRYVVAGNRVDVFKKIMTLDANYFFKNDVSVTEATWDRESTVILE